MSIRKLSHEFVLGRSTTSAIIDEVCAAINKLKDEFLPTPTATTWTENEIEFRRLGFPQIIGCLDGKHFWLKVVH
jgi:hypothetical protein